LISYPLDFFDDGANIDAQKKISKKQGWTSRGQITNHSLSVA